MSDEIIKPPNTSDNNLTPALSYIGNKIRVQLDRGCLKQDKITFSCGKIVNIYIVYDVNLCNFVNISDPTLGNSLFGAVKLVKNTDIEKYKYSGYCNEFNVKGTSFFFLLVGLVRIW